MRVALSFALSLVSALVLVMLSAPTAQAAECGTLVLPMALTDMPGPGASGQACFQLHASGGDLQVTALDNVTIVWSAQVPPVPDFLVNMAVDTGVLQGPTGGLLTPSATDPVVNWVADGFGGVDSWQAGRVWHFDVPAAGDYVLTLHMSGSDLTSAYSLGVSAVPEPASAALWALGLACLLGAVRRRQVGAGPRCMSPDSSTRTPPARGTSASSAAATLAASIG